MSRPTAVAALAFLLLAQGAALADPEPAPVPAPKLVCQPTEPEYRGTEPIGEAVQHVWQGDCRFAHQGALPTGAGMLFPDVTSSPRLHPRHDWYCMSPTRYVTPPCRIQCCWIE